MKYMCIYMFENYVSFNFSFSSKSKCYYKFCFRRKCYICKIIDIVDKYFCLLKCILFLVFFSYVIL